MADLKVLVIGAGLGGLCLAQALTRSGISVELFERDEGPFDRPQGYRLHLDADAINAAREVLTPDLRALFEATAFYTAPYTTILGRDLSVIKRLPTDDDHGPDIWPPRESAPIHCNVDRATLRQILLAGLDASIHYGKVLVSYDSGPGGVVAHFADGSSVQGDVLVGADGIRSAVRRQRAPQCDTVDAGISAIYGRIPIDRARAIVPPETLDDIFTIASDERKVFLGLGAVRFPSPPDAAAAQIAPGTSMRPQDDYVVCIVGGRREHFPSDLRNANGATLQSTAVDIIADWPQAARDVVQAGDSSAFFPVEMYTSVPCTLDLPTNVTLLGDAIHAMTPTLGRGANVAMRDGTLLGRHLRSVAAGEMTLTNALADYERSMLDYGFAVVREAAAIGEQRMAQNPLPN